MRDNDPLSGTPAQRAIAANVRVELARANISGAQMARRIDIAQSTFARRMTGDASFSAEEIAGIAAELGISADALLVGAAERAEANVA